MSIDTIADQGIRNSALNPEASFIVQAPAGSGKTGLLTQRFIALLAIVDEPEEIIAITFTIKAAAEMRNRILQALERAVDDTAPVESYEQQTWELAKKALERDYEKGWSLLENPSRLRIQTIDSLCTSLTRQMPVLSRFGSVPAITDDAQSLYMEAARNAIAELEEDSDWAGAIEHLLKHLDNQQGKVQNLIASMLAKRDQWLRHIIHPDNPGLDRESLEAAMTMVIEEALMEVASLVPEHCKGKLLELASFAANHLPADSNAKIAELNISKLPGADISELEQWQGLAELLLTKSKNAKTKKFWRSRVTKAEGFPAPSEVKDKDEKALYKDSKAEMLELIGSLNESDDLHEKLNMVRMLPPQKYTDDEWLTLQALINVLRLAVVNLEFVFKNQGQVDFSALALAALNALGNEEAPTDLALALDYRVRHLLVDEFQDTSYNQFSLIKKLTAGWQHGDGRTLFCVGDPMQSIYGFREANVGLFLEAKEKGIGDVRLDFLNLTVNFRSQHGIVDWINQQFEHVLPEHDNASKSAVSYAASTSFHPRLDGEAVKVYPSLENDAFAEALQVISIVQQTKQDDPESTIAIIVRSRSHLVQIIDQLKKAKLSYQAVEIEKLAQQPVIQDLLAITRALNHRADRIAWLSVLRAPYCGLTLRDLHAIAGDDLNSAIIDLLNLPQHVEKLSEDGRNRLTRVLPLLNAAISEQARSTLRNAVEGLWLSLGGPACVQNKTDLKDAEMFFQLLEEISDENGDLDIQKLNEKVDSMYALPDIEADGKLQLLTLHKAKGLEFDTVILPGLGRAPMSDSSKLLHWQEFGHEASHRSLVLAPISPLGEVANKTVDYLKFLDNEKRHYEDGRLLYVAATRAKKRLHLLGHTTVKENKKEGGFELQKPVASTLLNSLWDAVKSDYQVLFSDYVAGHSDSEPHEVSTVNSFRSRLKDHWQLPEPPGYVHIASRTKKQETGDPIEFSWASETARHVGTVVHRFLQRMGEAGIENITPEELKDFRHIARSMLIRLGVPSESLESALDKVDKTLQVVLADEKGRWILSNNHQNAQCEYALSGVHNGFVKNIIIDRTFIDEKGTRWIIDYKTGSHSGSGLEEYLDREQERYRSQLSGYADIISRTENTSIRLALYFPVMGGWREWSV